MKSELTALESIASANFPVSTPFTDRYLMRYYDSIQAYIFEPHALQIHMIIAVDIGRRTFSTDKDWFVPCPPRG